MICKTNCPVWCKVTQTNDSSREREWELTGSAHAADITIYVTTQQRARKSKLQKQWK